LPPHISTIEEQIQRIRENFDCLNTPLQKHIQLRALQERNETLFYAFVLAYIEEVMPIIYTPTVGQAVEEYSHIFRFPRGLYLSPTTVNRLTETLQAFRDVALIVVTDSEGILGIGDQGIGGMGIPIGKLSLYTAGAGIHPVRCLPVTLDVGTNNEALLNDPLYLGIRQKRLRGDAYFAFIDTFVQQVKQSLPQALIQWEDFSKQNAFSILDCYRESVLSFNDDIQGTGAMALAGVLTALKMAGQQLRQQVFVVYGTGAGGAGIARQIRAGLMKEGLTEAEATARIFSLDSRGLITTGREGVEPYKETLAHDPNSISHWRLERPNRIGLLDTVVNAKATVLIGTSGQPNSFTGAVVKAMLTNTPRPVIFPLSNPTSKTEAQPIDLYRWTDGKAIVATGSPFAPVEHNGKQHRIGQGNNAFIFPGIGLGTLAVRAKQVTDAMCTAAAMALHRATTGHDAVFPPIRQFREIAHIVAVAVAEEAIASGVATQLPTGDLGATIADLMWTPTYRPYRRG